jgi:ABC-type glutathione transport system ATPase component
MNPLLQVHLTAGYPGRAEVLRDVIFDIAEGEILGLMGESGSGKSTLALALLRLLDYKGGTAQGHVIFEHRDLQLLNAREMRSIRGKAIALVLQSAVSSLNPALRIGTQLAEAWQAHSSGSAIHWKRRVIEIFEKVSLPTDDKFLNRYPRQLSVGQAQRVMIVMAVLHGPRLLIADEPTSALDAITQSEVLDLLRLLNRELKMAVLFISHDLLSIASLCSRVAILEQGHIVESGPTTRIFRNPVHPYTQALLRALPGVIRTGTSQIA